MSVWENIMFLEKWNLLAGVRKTLAQSGMAGHSLVVILLEQATELGKLRQVL